jgi:hypothetical protein
MRSLHINKYQGKPQQKKSQRRLHDLNQIWVLKNSLNWYFTFNFTHTNYDNEFYKGLSQSTTRVSHHWFTRSHHKKLEEQNSRTSR